MLKQLAVDLQWEGCIHGPVQDIDRQGEEDIYENGLFFSTLDNAK